MDNYALITVLKLCIIHYIHATCPWDGWILVYGHMIKLSNTHLAQKCLSKVPNVIWCSGKRIWLWEMTMLCLYNVLLCLLSYTASFMFNSFKRLIAWQFLLTYRISSFIHAWEVGFQEDRKVLWICQFPTVIQSKNVLYLLHTEQIQPKKWTLIVLKSGQYSYAVQPAIWSVGKMKSVERQLVSSTPQYCQLYSVTTKSLQLMDHYKMKSS